MLDINEVIFLHKPSSIGQGRHLSRVMWVSKYQGKVGKKKKEFRDSKKRSLGIQVEFSSSSPTFIPKTQFQSQFRNPYKTTISNFFFYYKSFEGTEGWPRSLNILCKKALIISSPFSFPAFSSLLFVHHTLKNTEKNKRVALGPALSQLVRSHSWTNR